MSAAAAAPRSTEPMPDPASRFVAFRCVAGFITLVMGLTGGHLLVTGWSDPLDGGLHQLQDLHWGVTEGLLLAGALGWQLRHPARHAGAMRVAVLAVLAQLLAAIATLGPDPFGIVLLLLVGLALRLHPARRDVLHPAVRPDRRLLAVTVPGAVTLLAFAGLQISHHFSASTHDLLEAKNGWLGATIGSISLAVTLLAAALLRSTAATTLTAAGLAVLGLGSVLHPHTPSSFGTIGGTLSLLGLAAISWSAYANLRRPAARRAQTLKPPSATTIETDSKIAANPFPHR